jgi:hypothetical protein
MRQLRCLEEGAHAATATLAAQYLEICGEL